MFFLFTLPLLSFLLVVLIVYPGQLSGGPITRIRMAMLNSILFNSLFILISTESLSYFNLLRFGALLSVWLFWVFALTVYAWHNRLFGTHIKTIFQNVKGVFSGNRLLLTLVPLFVISFIISLIYPTNNFDSLTYHMARVAHWKQHASIAHYKTHVLRQIEFPPFGEWIILHLQILTGTDRFANSVQLFFLAGCIVAVSLICRELGGKNKQQVLAAVLAAFIPMAVLQSNTTQNDIIAAFYLLCFVYFSIRLLQQQHFYLFLLAGISLGLAWLTKSTTYIFSMVFCAWYILIVVKRSNIPFLKRSALCVLVPVIAIAINSGHYYRNIFFAGSPFGFGTDGAVNEAFEVKPIAFLAVKNLMCHFPVSSSFKGKVAAKAVQWGIDPDDPRYNQTGMNMIAEGFSFHEDYAQNFFHVILITVCLLIYFLRKNTYSGPKKNYLLFICSLLILCVIFSSVLQWQPWGNRLETSIFMLFSVFLGIEMGYFNKWIRAVSVSAIIVYGFVALFLSSRHPLLPVKHSVLGSPFTYNDFIYDKELLGLKKYLDAKPYTKIGLYIGSDSWDYPYYKLLGDKRTLRHVFVQNPSMMYLDDFIPEALITLEASVEKYTIGTKVYRRTGIYKNAVLFEAESESPSN